MNEATDSEAIVCANCGEESDYFVSTDFDDGDLCEHCADLVTEEYSL